ncbi:MAG TPA: hypothetical protein VGE74_01240 [Gemmata sp.]
MFRPLVLSHRRPPRRGTAILITCFFLITVMMVTGLALVMYAAREKAAALAFQDGAAVPRRSAPSPENTVNTFLSALVYDTLDDGTALQNSIRGHSIGRAMWGSNPTGQAGWTGTTTPWNGVGVFHEQADSYGIGALNGQDRGRFINQTALSVGGQFLLLDPEWTGNRPVAGGALSTFATSVAGRNYVSKAAGYTYPDLKNFFLGAQDPVTGEVLVPSFHRDSLFGTLAPSNPNWTNEIGKMRTLRPRPQEHPNFPRVPPNADGVLKSDGTWLVQPTYTGDVQNLPGAFSYDPNTKQFNAKNDSLWMYTGLPPITLSDGRRVIPMVAPLILPLDGRFDLSIHGNQLGGNGHRSFGGYGPWEVNMGYGMTDRNAPTPLPLAANLETDRQNLMAQRGVSRNAEFNPYLNAQLTAAGQTQLLPQYAPVAWSGKLTTFQLPTAASMLGLPSFGNPSFTPPYGDYESSNAQIANHPAGYNSDTFAPRSNTAPNTGSPVYPFTDVKRLTLRYAFNPDWYNQAFVTQTATPTFLTAGGFPYYANPTATTPSNYRLDPAHARRGLWVPRAMGLDRPALAPTFLSRDGGNALALVPPTVTPGVQPQPAKPGLLVPAGIAYPDPTVATTVPGTVTDFAPTAGTTKQWYNVQAALGSVNLNRPLADYRSDVTKPLLPDPTQAPSGGGNNNVTPVTAATADADRQALAKDIFARLIVTTGAAGQVTFDPTNGVQIALPDPTSRQIAGVAYTQEQYDALRYLAQLAVNIVDYIDNDDISTTFVWNPSGGGLAADLATAQVGNRVVFGIEKPRLVLNEVYGEITNDPADKEEDKNGMGMNQPLQMTAKAHVRFWAELLNPTSPPYTAAPQGVLGDGSVPLSAYRLQLSRASRTFGPSGTLPAAQQDNPAGPLTDTTNAKYAANTMGTFDTSVAQPDATCTLSALTLQTQSVQPNNAQYAPATAAPANGVVLLRTDISGTNSPKTDEFDPTTTSAATWMSAVVCPKPDQPNALGYTIQMPTGAQLSAQEFKRHVVLLQRLANPYLPYSPASNPYVTVDMMDYVPAFDAVIRAAGQADKRTARPAANPKNDGTEYDPMKDATAANNRFSVGKVQPLAGLSFATTSGTAGTYNKYLFNGATAPALNSMVLNQTANPKPGEPLNTLGRHNGTNATQPTGTTVTVTANAAATLNTGDTIMLPFDWQQHMDRPLETLGDVFFVRDTKPHLLTQEFVVNTATGLNYTFSSAKWAQHSDGLARALALLSVKSPKLTDAHGGRIGGKVNPNVVQDRRIVQGVWDPQSNNQFDLTFVNDTVWGKWMASRSALQTKYQADGAPTSAFMSPVPTSSVHDLATGADRPFQPYGAPSAATGTFAYTTPSATNDGDTLMRIDSTTGKPYLYQTTQTHPYLQTEPLRKVMNNLTTVSHTFVVYLTIGYFKYEGDQNPAGWPTGVPLPPQIGAEEYDQIPGDMRQKYIAVIDMSNMALDPNAPAHASGQPFFTALTATARKGANAALSFPTLSYDSANGKLFVAADGYTMPIQSGDSLVLGSGSETQVVTVASVVGRDATTGVGQVTVTNLPRDAWGGTCVSNVRPGYIGPQPNFKYNSPQYQPVVPYVERLR